MTNAINSFGGFNQPVRQNPDDYAKLYAEQNGLSVEDAKAELKAKYGDPKAQEEAGSFNSFNSYNNSYSSQDIATLEEEIKSLEETLFGNQGNTDSSFMQSIMNFFRGNQSMDSDSLINPETNSKTGPQKEGDPQFHLHPDFQNYDFE